MRYRVLLIDDAEKDVEDIYRYIARHDSIESANRVLEGLEQCWNRLTDMPQRGNVPRELAALGVAEYRETYFKPYRIIYRIVGSDVVVYCVVDGRRDIQSFLARRNVR